MAPPTPAAGGLHGQSPWPGWAVAALLVNAATWGLSWWPFRHLNAAGLHPLWITACVYLLACIVILLWRPRAWGLLRREPALWAILLASGLTNATFNWAVTVGEVTRVVLLFYLTPLWTVVLARWLLGKAITRAVLLRMALALAGAALVLTAQPGGAGADLPATMRWGADALGLLGGLCFAATNVLLRREAGQPEEGRALAMFAGGVVVAGGVAVVAAALTAADPTLGAARVPWPPAWAWGWALPTAALALAFLVSNLALQYGAARLPANVTAVIMPTEVVFASASALAWGGERPALAVWLGGGLILCATALAARSRD